MSSPIVAGVRAPLPTAEPATLGLDPDQLDRLDALMRRHLADGRFPGAQIAVARHGRLAFVRTYGVVRLEPAMPPATDATLFMLHSQTKLAMAATIWQLVDRGALRFADRVADHVPEFAARHKGDVLIWHLLTHQGGFPSTPEPPAAAWADHALLRRWVSSEISLEWPPGSRVCYHSDTAWWVVAVVIEAVTGRDYRAVIRDDLLGPVGLGDSFMVGVPVEQHDRCAGMYTPDTNGSFVPWAHGGYTPPEPANTAAYRLAGLPGDSGFATAAGKAAFYQLLLAGGTLNGVRVLSPRVIEFATRNHTGDRVDERQGMPMHRGLGPHRRGETPTIRGLGTLAGPRTFGHGGVNTSYSWGDPDSGVSFSYLTNGHVRGAWHGVRLDLASNLVHAAIVAP